MSPLRFGALITIALLGSLLASLMAPARPDEMATGSPTPSVSASPASLPYLYSLHNTWL